MYKLTFVFTAFVFVVAKTNLSLIVLLFCKNESIFNYFIDCFCQYLYLSTVDQFTVFTITQRPLIVLLFFAKSNQPLIGLLTCLQKLINLWLFYCSCKNELTYNYFLTCFCKYLSNFDWFLTVFAKENQSTFDCITVFFTKMNKSLIILLTVFVDFFNLSSVYCFYKTHYLWLFYNFCKT